MPSFQDSAVIFFIALLLFGPKKLPELARYIGKLMAEFRRASSEFRTQMDDEFRQIEIAERQQKLAAIEAAAPATPTIAPPAATATEPAPADDYGNPPIPRPYYETEPEPQSAAISEPEPTPSPEPPASIEPLPIATSGDLSLMPPATGLPQARTASQAATETVAQESETHTHG